MSESVQITPSASAGAQQSKLSSLETGSNPESTDDPSEFTAVFASYTESDPNATEQQTDENLTELLSELLPENILKDGNMLPEQENVAMWQALMMIQPAENVLSSTTSTPTQSISLLDNSRKQMLNPQLLNQDYFQSLAVQNKDAGTSGVTAGLVTNNISAQLAAAHFTPESHESLLLNVNEQLMPVQGTNTSLSQSLAAVGLGTATQAATTQTQMAPLNLGQNAWETNLGSRLQMLVGQNVQTAEIRLDPPELGALDIKIKVTNDVATVSIASAHTQVREALETAVPKLREMFEENGLSLGDVNVRQETFSQQEKSAEEGGSGSHTHVAGSEHGDDPNLITKKIVSDNLLDIYA
jgi:flagellar hook-length control protein FliK